MNKLSALILFISSSLICPALMAATHQPPQRQDDLSIAVNVQSDQQDSWLVAGNSHTSEEIEINQEIGDINDEMDALGEEFKEDMLDMGKELKGLVKMLRKMGDKESGKGAFMGILLDDHKGVDEGVLLLGVTPDGPAQKAGLQADDIILSINQQQMAKSGELSPESILQKTLQTVKPGEPLKLVIKRNDELKVITFAAGKRGDHLHSGINFLADDLEKRIAKKIHIDIDDNHFSDIELYPVNDKLGKYFGTENGLLVLKINDENKFKLQEGDVILKIGERFPKTTSQTWRILESYDSGENIKFTIKRNQQQLVIEIPKP